jgi:hypothetical protein
MNTPRKKAHIIKASYRLMQKVGMGPVSPDLVAECEEFIKANEIDFQPWAKSCMDDLNNALERAMMDGSNVNDGVREDLIAPIMQLKASGAMFQNAPLSQLAGALLHFLESIPSLDQDVVEIIKANETVLNAFLSDKVQGMTPAKAQMISALQDACNRYAAKHDMRSLF